MVALIDTNVAINYLTNRDDENRVASRRLMELCGKRTVNGYCQSFYSDYLVCAQKVSGSGQKKVASGSMYDSYCCWRNP